MSSRQGDIDAPVAMAFDMDAVQPDVRFMLRAVHAACGSCCTPTSPTDSPCQETCRAGREGSQAGAEVFYRQSDLGTGSALTSALLPATTPTSWYVTSWCSSFAGPERERRDRLCAPALDSSENRSLKPLDQPTAGTRIDPD